VIVGPVLRRALQESETQALALDDDRRPRGGLVPARAGVGNAQAVEVLVRGEYRIRTVILVVGIADGMDAAEPQRLTRGRGGIKPS
jgi:hypothetical protein